jgi:GntR family transcriptional regulator of vanillate catabolism
MRPEANNHHDKDGLAASPVSPATLQQAVGDRLREMLLAGQFEPGCRLTEVTLAKSLGVSRTPLRAALTHLSQEGLITYSPNRGYEVRRISIDEIVERYEVRGTLEGMACRLVAEAGLDEDRRLSLQACLAEGAAIVYGELSAEETFDAWRRMNSKFHDILTHSCGNQCLRDLTAKTLSFPFVSQIVGRWNGPRNYQRAQTNHEMIVEAITARQSSRAEALMREHVFQSRDVARDILSKIMLL